MAQKNPNTFKSDNRIAVENREVFNRETNFITDLADSAYNTVVAEVEGVEDMAIVS